MSTLSTTDENNVGKWYELGISAYGSARYNEAIEYFEKAMELDSDAWNNKGHVLGNYEEYEEAVKCFDEAIKCFDPDTDQKLAHRSFDNYIK